MMKPALMLGCLLGSSLSFAGTVGRALGDDVAAGRHRDIDAVIVTQGDRVVFSGARKNLDWQDIDIRSATKSVTALLVGIAIERGHIASVDVPVAQLLPEFGEAFAEPMRGRMRLRDLLTMRSGLDCDDWVPGSPGHEDTMYAQRDWLEFWSEVPMRDEPGTRFSYCTGNVIALGRILVHATGEPVPAFARRVLFEPLEIEGARWATWNRGRDTDTGGHLAISPEGLLKIGRLVLAGGSWKGREIVDAAWLQAMTTARTDIPDRPQRYGYLWWIDQTRLASLPRTRLLMAWGNGGNFLVVLPELDAVFVSIGRRYNQPEGLEPLHWLRDRVLPALAAEATSDETN